MNQPPTFTPESKLADVLDYYVSTNPRIQSDQTVRRYHATLIALDKYLKRPATIADLNPDTYGGWCRYRREAVGVALSTLHGEAQKLCVVWRWLAKRHEAPECTVMLPKHTQPEHTTWCKDEWERIEKAGRECEWYVGDTPGNLFWPAFLGVSLETGERIGAVYQLEVHHFDKVKKQVFFPRDFRKGQTRDLTKPISELTLEDCERLFAVRKVRPFAPLMRNSMYHPMRRLLCDAGLPSGRTRLYHCIRRYHATQVELMGGNATRSLDHCDPRITETYIDKTQLPGQPMPMRPRFDEPTENISEVETAGFIAASITAMLAWLGR